jgi:peptide/nickel transport system substrate-binding protein
MMAFLNGYRAADGKVRWGREYLITLREGLRWSDGEPFTVDDIMWWYENVYLHDEIGGTPGDLVTADGVGHLERISDYQVDYVFPEPNFLFEEVLRGDSEIGGGPGRWWGSGMGGYAPAHYLKQFHPKYVSKEELERKVKEAKFDNWVNLFKFKIDWALNPELPVVSP